MAMEVRCPLDPFFWTLHMIVRLPGVLGEEQLALLTSKLGAADAAWIDGRATAGHQGARVKQNRQLAEGSALARELREVVLAAVERNPLFVSAVLPRHIYPPLFNRYEPGMHFGNHVDGAVRRIPGPAIPCVPTFRRPCSCRHPTATTAANW